MVPMTRTSVNFFVGSDFKKRSLRENTLCSDKVAG